MKIPGFLTPKGLALTAKLSTGTPLTITRVVAGSGETAETAGELAQPRQTLTVNSPRSSGESAIIPVTLTAVSASENYALTELGVYADDPDEGEILYKVYQLDVPVDITAGASSTLRFYLRETVSWETNVTVNCSPAGLITETEFEPVRKKVLATALPIREVTLDAGELPAYIASLPRLLTEILDITVSGTLTEAVHMDAFYGGGCIYIRAAALGKFILQNQITLNRCEVPVLFWNLQLEEPAGMSKNGALVSAEFSPFIYLNNCKLSGYDPTVGTRGVACSYGSAAVVDSCGICNFDTAVFASRGSTVAVNAASPDVYRDNTIGAYAWWGGIVFLGEATPETLGGSTNWKNGGIIAKKDGTLL